MRGVISMLADPLPSFVQSLDPLHTTLGTTLVALVPIILLLILALFGGLGFAAPESFPEVIDHRARA